MVCRLVPMLAPELKRAGLEPLFREVELPLVPVLATMEQNGIAVDVPYLQALSKEMADRLAEIEKAAYASVGPRVQPRLAQAARRRALQGAQAAAVEADADRPGLDRRRGAGGAPRRPPGHRADPRAPPHGEAEVDLRRRAAADGQSGDGPRPRLVQPDRRRDRPPLQHRPEPPEHPDPHRSRQAGAAGVHHRLCRTPAC